MYYDQKTFNEKRNSNFNAGSFYNNMALKMLKYGDDGVYKYE